MSLFGVDSGNERGAMKNIDGLMICPVRRFATRGRLLLGMVLLVLGLSGHGVWASGKAEALLLTCMDYRLIDDTERYMSERGLQNNYDQLILAGASLGAVTDSYPAWNQTFWEHLDISLQLHGIHTVILLDHRDCGAYKVILKEDFAAEPEREMTVHTEYLEKLTREIHEKYPQLLVETLLMNLEGEVEEIEVETGALLATPE